MPPVKGMSQAVPSHLLQVGQADPENQDQDQDQDLDLELSLENLNQLILELDPTFEPIPVKSYPASPPAELRLSDESDRLPPRCALVSRGCSPNIPIPAAAGGLRGGHQGAPALSGSPASCLPPLPFGSAPRRNRSPQGSLRLCRSNRNSAASLLSTSTCSDTSYILGSNLSLAGDDADSPDLVPDDPGVRSPEIRLCPAKKGQTAELHLRGAQSRSGSLSDVPLLLVNGAPQSSPSRNDPDLDLFLNPPPSPSGPASGSQSSMRFVMDTSKFWFRSHISRTEAEAFLKDEEPGAFVIRDSTSYRGSFGLAMKVDQSSPELSTSKCPGESRSELIRHFLIESSAKGVRIRGSSCEPYFGSLSALVYQHTISAFALPCRLLLRATDANVAEEKNPEVAPAEDWTRTAGNFVYLSAVSTETLTGALAVQRAVSCMLGKAPGSFTPAVVNVKVSAKGVTLTDVNRKLFFRRHYPTHSLSYAGEDPDHRLWWRGSSFGARTFGFVAKSAEAGVENVCHVFAEYDPLQPCAAAVHAIRAALDQP